jgi:aminoglycoside 6'-N-acetyltransferase
MPHPSISFRSFRKDDFPQLLTWFRAPHVAQWWPVPESDAVVAEKYLPRIRGEEDINMFAILAEKIPVGMAQIGPADDQYAAGHRACSIDLLIGDIKLISVGLGPLIIDALVLTEVFEHRNYSVCLADPQEENRRSVRAFEKAGFALRQRVQKESQIFLLLARSRSTPVTS